LGSVNKVYACDHRKLTHLLYSIFQIHVNQMVT